MPGGEPGKSYRASLDEAYLPGVSDVLFDGSYANPLATCGSLDSLGAGTTVSFKINSVKDGGPYCVVYQADVVLPPSVQVIDTGGSLSGRYVSSLALFDAKVSVGSCVGTLEINFVSLNRQPLAAKSPDKWPPFLMIRTLQTKDAANCPTFAGATGTFECSDTWVSTLAPQ